MAEGVNSYKNFFNYISDTLDIPAMQFYRDQNFDEPQKMRSAGVRGKKEFDKKSAIYFGKQPSFDSILQRIKLHLHRL